MVDRCRYDSIRRRVVRFMNMILTPLVLGILQNGELIWCQQRLDFIDGCHPVWLETGPDSLQLLPRRLNLCSVARCTRLTNRFQSSINPGLIGHLISLAGVGKVVLDWLQFGCLLIGEIQLLLEASRKQQSFALKRSLGLPGLGVGGEDVLCQQYWRSQQQ